MSSKLTREQIDEYTSSGGVICPYCGSDDLRGGDREFNDGLGLQDVHCLSCGEQWTDVYKLVDISED